MTNNKVPRNFKIDYNDFDIKEIENINKKIMLLLEKLNTMDLYSSNAINVRAEINKLAQEREKIVYTYLGDGGVTFIRNIESMERNVAATFDSDTQKPRVLSTTSYLKELKNTILILADLKFYKLDSKYLSDEENKEDMFKELYFNTIKKYHNLVSSLYGRGNVMIANGISSSELLSYFSIYNLDSSYSNFKKKYPNLMIGGDKVKSKDYNKSVNDLNNLINLFLAKSKNRLEKTSGKVRIVDSFENKKILKKELEENMNVLYKYILYYKLNGVKNVSR